MFFRRRRRLRPPEEITEENLAEEIAKLTAQERQALTELVEQTLYELAVARIARMN